MSKVITGTGKAASTKSIITLESFKKPSHIWNTANDPVIGGESSASFIIKDGYGMFHGEVVDVPLLHAPCFTSVIGIGNYPDVSTCTSIVLKALTNESYGGYRISFGLRHVPGFEEEYAVGYKANFHIGPNEKNMDKMGSRHIGGGDIGEEIEFEEIVIPMSSFTLAWSTLTGDPIVSCQENQEYCPDEETLQNIKSMAIWGEGVAGNVSLIIDSIKASGCISRNEENILQQQQKSPGKMKWVQAGGFGLIFIGFIFGAFYVVRALRFSTTRYEE